MYRFDKIKLVIWDMDETFWNGTITEGNVTIPEEHIKLIKDLTDAGIINSICSKNDFQLVVDELKKYDLDEFFVFPSINWEPKGNRIKQLISDMQLRPANVIFIDDNPSNLGEAEHFCPEIMVSSPQAIPQLINDVSGCEKKDIEHKRLKQYKVLEEKHTEKANYSSNEAFLMESGIRVEISNDCITEIKRIHDLILRSNQLNFTKIRSTEDELSVLLQDKNYDCGYVSVSDRFGDYGIVGFYAKKDNRLEHFVFSCRTLGMGIEQYVYNILERPELTISGEVISDLTSTELPKWINQKENVKSAEKMQIRGIQQHQVLIKGPCDLFQVFPYISDTEMFDAEFTYALDSGLTIESTGHTTHIVESHRLSAEQKNRVVNEVPFSDMGMYSDALFTKEYKVAIISILADANLGVYRRKDTGERIAVMEYIHPLTDKASWEGIVSGEYPHTGFDFTEEHLVDFTEKYEFLGRNDAQTTLENLKYIRENLSEDCLLVIMLGGELYYEKNTFEAYNDRHIVHKEMNAKIREWAKNIENVRLIDVNKYLVDQSSFYDHFNHYIKPIYYKIAGEIVDIINEHIGSNIRETSKLKMIKIRVKEILAPVYYRLRKIVRK
ncbi:MAG: HAD-IIIC family phosphatase [Ruminococcaceae bacterium]|nr:HAD-IIIC family phosphatase [Oscillospiraceae bacterium]